MDVAEQGAIRSAQPAQLRRPIGTTQHAAGFRVDFSFVEFFAQPRGIRPRSCISPCENRRERSRFSIKSEEPVPERAATDSNNPLLRRRTPQRFPKACSNGTL